VELGIEVVVGHDGRLLFRRETPDLHRLLGEPQARFLRIAPGVEVGGIAGEEIVPGSAREPALPLLSS
jgi:hypothetical protein